MTTDEHLISEAGRRLAAATPDARVILFGSHARGEAHPDSDPDLLVIEPELKSRRAEFVRLREALGNLGVPIDLIVVPASHVDEWGHFEGTMLSGVELPVPRSLFAELTDFAVPLRYEDLLDAEALDRQATIALVGQIAKWVTDRLD